jgi:hypothetical protein
VLEASVLSVDDSELKIDDDLLLFVLILVVCRLQRLQARSLASCRRLYNWNRGQDRIVVWREQPILMKRALGCSPSCFDSLVNWLSRHGMRESRGLGVDEKTAIFL